MRTRVPLTCGTTVLVCKACTAVCVVLVRRHACGCCALHCAESAWLHSTLKTTWQGRRSASVVVSGTLIFLIGGAAFDGTTLSDVWYSQDGLGGACGGTNVM